MTPKIFEISLSQAIGIILDRAENSITWADFVDQVLERWPSTAKKPADSIANALRYEFRNRIVLLEDKTVVPVSLIMKDARFRITLSSEEIEKSAISLIPWFVPYYCDFQWQINLEKKPPKLFDKNYDPINFEASSVPIKQLGWGGDEIFEDMLALKVDDWFDSIKPQVEDSILVTIKDYNAKAFILEYEPAGARRSIEIEDQNKALAKGIEKALFDAQDDVSLAIEILKIVYADLGDVIRKYPGDHWIKVVEADRRFGTDYYHIGLARFIFFDGVLPLIQDVDSKSLQQVYRFKAYLKNRKSIWRKIEIGGSNSLGDFNEEMRHAFEHDWDHLSEFFYKPSDRGRHGRWEGYGSHNPFESRYADEIMIAELGLEAGDQLKWVYDFGDWVEYFLTLEEVTQANDKFEYPRVIEKNKPRYHSCVNCTAMGFNKRAVWVCVWCSTSEGSEIWLCENCMMKLHDEHHVEKILY
jgi:hypothetical protein